MLTQLTINNFAIVRHLELEFAPNMTVMTGETGAGKSIAIDALSLCLGERAESSMIRPGASRVDVCAQFSINHNGAAQQWLINNQLDNQQDCLLRRVINTDGRSKAFINGIAVPVSQLKEIGSFLIQIHGQYFHQQLLKSDYQKQLLDHYMNQPELLLDMKKAYQTWRHSHEQLTLYQQQTQQLEAQKQLLEYQLKELKEFSPQPDEYQQLEKDYKKLTNTKQLIELSQSIANLISEQEQINLLKQLQHARQYMESLVQLDDQLTNALQMLNEAYIQLEEAGYEIKHYSEHIIIDPEKLNMLETRLTHWINLAKKHHIQPEELAKHYHKLIDEYQYIKTIEDQSDTLKIQCEQNKHKALYIAEQLHEQRHHYAPRLAQELTEKIHLLAMPQGKIHITTDFKATQIMADGCSTVEITAITNTGQHFQPIAKIASGGELSRIALAIQVINANKTEKPTLIFDEVDTGISGATAAIVGQLLNELGKTTQVICITHLPQVAGYGNQHYLVKKLTANEKTETIIEKLNEKERIEEMARLLGGSKITKNTLANAKELLKNQ